MSRRKTTVKDIAEYARVSTATVSRVVNGSGYVSAEVMQRVLDAIEKLEYRPNAVARGLKNSKTNLVAIMISDITNPFFSAIVKGAESVLLSEGYTTILCSTDKDVGKERNYLKLMVENRVSGFIISAASDEFEHFKEAKGVPLMFVNRRPEGLKAPAVLADNYHGAHRAVEHLLGLGHTKIATIAGPQNINTGRDRLKGYLDALERAGMTCHKDYVTYGDFHKESGYDAMIKLLRLDRPPTAVFVANNQMTLGALMALGKEKIVVGRDLSLVAFDETEWASIMNPPLTTVEQPAYQMGLESAKLLVSYLNRNVVRPRSHELYLDPRLIIRESSCRVAVKSE